MSSFFMALISSGDLPLIFRLMFIIAASRQTLVTSAPEYALSFLEMSLSLISSSSFTSSRQSLSRDSRASARKESDNANQVLGQEL